MRIAIVGLGLIGGSVALAARARRVASHVTAIDHADVLLLPEARAAVDDQCDASDEARSMRVVASAELTLLAMPVGAIQSSIGRWLEVAQVLTDCGSTKRAVLASATRSDRRGRFVPGHPMAGLPQGGIQRARADLFAGRPWLLCPDESDADAVTLVEAFVRALGAEPQRLGVGEHDRAVALTSHVPQLFASALAVLAEARRAGAAAGPAFESATRVAGGNEAMWRDILGTNADEVSAVLDALGSELEAVRRGLHQTPADLGPALQLLERARALRGRP